MDPSKPPMPGTLVPDIVKNIPMQTQAGAAARPVDEDDELDRIMHDVGDDLKQIGKRPAKKHRGLFNHKAKKPAPDAKLHDQPLPSAQMQPLAVPAHQPVVKQPKTPKTSSLPVLVILVVIAVTGALVTAAYYAYK